MIFVLFETIRTLKVNKKSQLVEGLPYVRFIGAFKDKKKLRETANKYTEHYWSKFDHMTENHIDKAIESHKKESPNNAEPYCVIWDDCTEDAQKGLCVLIRDKDDSTRPYTFP